MSTILGDIKSLMGSYYDGEDFDKTFILHINTVFAELRILGAGPKDGFSISTGTETWDSFSDNDNLNRLIKTYIFLKVSMLFDPNGTAAVLNTLKEEIAKYEFLIMVEVETMPITNPTEGG